MMLLQQRLGPPHTKSVCLSLSFLLPIPRSPIIAMGLATADLQVLLILILVTLVDQTVQRVDPQAVVACEVHRAR